MLAAKSEHSDNLIQRWVEPRSSCRAYAHLPDITTSTSFQRISGMLKSTNFASQEQTSDCYSKPVVQIESQALSVNLPMLYRDIEFWKKKSLVTLPMSLTDSLTLEKNSINPNAAQGQGLRRTSSKWVLKSAQAKTRFVGKSTPGLAVIPPVLVTDWSCGSWLCSDVSVRQTSSEMLHEVFARSILTQVSY